MAAAAAAINSTSLECGVGMRGRDGMGNGIRWLSRCESHRIVILFVLLVLGASEHLPVDAASATRSWRGRCYALRPSVCGGACSPLHALNSKLQRDYRQTPGRTVGCVAARVVPHCNRGEHPWKKAHIDGPPAAANAAAEGAGDLRNEAAHDTLYHPLRRKRWLLTLHTG
eukprot:GHVU01091692.1.p1 GENE.GHVU01091692.1~~GHVU01091692.1.p1  ORF type:complete len:170 (+),score=14.20 GHVU01091692.1:1045-1554(+)